MTADSSVGVLAWPMDNYAIPQPVTGCPPDFTSTSFVHLQGRNGFHYSQVRQLGNIKAGADSDEVYDDV